MTNLNWTIAGISQSVFVTELNLIFLLMFLYPRCVTLLSTEPKMFWDEVLRDSADSSLISSSPFGSIPPPPIKPGKDLCVGGGGITPAEQSSADNYLPMQRRRNTVTNKRKELQYAKHADGSQTGREELRSQRQQGMLSGPDASELALVMFLIVSDAFLLILR